MPAFCCVVNCGSRGERDPVKFFRIPAIRSFVNKIQLNELSATRRRKWLNAIKRADLTEQKQKYALVCSKHFVTGVESERKPAKLEDVLHPDWVPSVNMGYNVHKSVAKESRYKRWENWTQVGKKQSDLQSERLLNVSDMECSELMDSTVHASKLCQTDLTVEQISQMFLKLAANDKFNDKFVKLTISYKSLEDNDTKTKYYTGLDNYKVFQVVVEAMEPFITVHGNTALPAKEQVLLCLLKLRLNLDYKDIAYRFGISPFSASTYFKNVIRIMRLRLKHLVFWPSREVLMKTMPTCFKESFQDKASVIIDCFEIVMETPANLLAKAQSWSSYKHHQTVKYLIGITPQGSVSFISEGWGGRVSDKFLTEHSEFLDNLLPGDVIIADRGFLIKQFVELFHAQVKIPAFTKGKSQLHPVDLERTRAIAHVRIHVERVIGVLRQKFRILSDKIPMSLINTGEEAILDEILFVSCALFNICPPIVPL
ncbi:hypothetical protein NQ315_002560 [Exocentrus adspersus]|uniref:THAP-type domain-containing protein n=1 Tax=Exocentrus adspersus TaxID=1586481 RepID=A0AAV8V7X8_9CUCU|nr:hypothetical protein NQ315_002560 [Exocentrus adspersus]